MKNINTDAIERKFRYKLKGYFGIEVYTKEQKSALEHTYRRFCRHIFETIMGFERRLPTDDDWLKFSEIVDRLDFHSFDWSLLKFGPINGPRIAEMLKAASRPVPPKEVEEFFTLVCRFDASTIFPEPHEVVSYHTGQVAAAGALAEAKKDKKYRGFTLTHERHEVIAREGPQSLMDYEGFPDSD